MALLQRLPGIAAPALGVSRTRPRRLRHLHLSADRHASRSLQPAGQRLCCRLHRHAAHEFHEGQRRRNRRRARHGARRDVRHHRHRAALHELISFIVGHSELGGATTLFFPEPGFAVQLPGQMPARREEAMSLNLPPERTVTIRRCRSTRRGRHPRPSPNLPHKGAREGGAKGSTRPRSRRCAQLL